MFVRDQQGRKWAVHSTGGRPVDEHRVVNIVTVGTATNWHDADAVYQSYTPDEVWRVSEIEWSLAGGPTDVLLWRYAD